MSKRLFYIVIVLLFAWNLWSLPYSPIVWLDEAMISSYTHSFVAGNGIAMELDEGSPVYIYGPVFFIIESFFIKLFGFTPFVCRLVNFLFAFISVIILGRVLDLLKINVKFKYLAMLLLVTDVTFMSNSHSARMEFVAIFFALSAYWYYLKSSYNTMIRALMVSLLLTLSFMTTPRSVVICIPVAFILFYELLKDNAWKSLVVYVAIPIVLYSIWIFYAFGSYGTMIDYYTKPTEISQNVSLLQRFVGMNIRIPLWHYPIIITSFFFVVHSILRKYWKHLLIYISTIILFYLLVYDMGMYDIYIIPFYLIVISICSEKVNTDNKHILARIGNGLIKMCLILNFFVLTLKGVTIMATREMRDHEAMSEWINNNIPSNSRVAGSYAYYYAAINHGCKYKRLERDNIEAPKVYEYLLRYQPEYIVISRQQMADVEEKCFDMFDKELISTYNPPKPDNILLLKLLEKSGSVFNSSYEGELYKVHYSE